MLYTFTWNTKKNYEMTDYGQQKKAKTKDPLAREGTAEDAAQVLCDEKLVSDRKVSGWVVMDFKRDQGSGLDPVMSPGREEKTIT